MNITSGIDCIFSLVLENKSDNLECRGIILLLQETKEEMNGH